MLFWKITLVIAGCIMLPWHLDVSYVRQIIGVSGPLQLLHFSKAHNVLVWFINCGASWRRLLYWATLHMFTQKCPTVTIKVCIGRNLRLGYYGVSSREMCLRWCCQSLIVQNSKGRFMGVAIKINWFEFLRMRNTFQQKICEKYRCLR